MASVKDIRGEVREFLPGLTIVAYSAEPGSPSAQAKRLLIPGRCGS